MKRTLSKVVELCEGGRLKPPFATTYQEEGHQYFIDGENVPSVTQVVDQLQDWRGIDAAVLARAAERGTLIHLACEYYIKRILDWSSVDPSILPEVQTFASWWDGARFKPLLVEGIVGSKQYKFAGRLDLFGIWKTGLAIVDFKTGAEFPAYRFQTAGLEIALGESLVGVQPFNVQRYCLYLKGDKVRPVQHEDPRDRPRFLAALTCSHTRRELYP